MIMKSVSENRPNEVVELSNEETNFKELAKSQWALINQLERRYFGEKVFGTSCEFQDNSWFNGDGRSDQGRITWRESWTKNKALEVLLKVVYFEKLATDRTVISSLRANSLNVQKKTLIPIIQSRNLLTGDVGDYLLGLSQITDEDLLVALDSYLATNPTKETFISRCNELASLIESINHIAELAPFYQIRARLPWEKDGKTARAWATNRALDLEEIFGETDGFQPLPAETLFPIIERSLSLILDYGEYFATLRKAIKTSPPNTYSYTKLADDLALEAIEKYGTIFSDIIAPPDIGPLGKTKKGAEAARKWIRKLLYLARGACVNIILLTTGLRNSDIRDLKVGACRPSGRLDMLYYLRASIRKTSNVVELPVPSQTDKAVKLLESIKFTNSLYLIDGASVASLDRMCAGNTINNMIRRFAEHFKIPFSVNSVGDEASAHCYRTTVAGWLGSASNLSVLMVRRLFGHSNDVMPSVYLRNNPSFVRQAQKEKERAAEETAHQMALAASQGKVAGAKGNELERGYKNLRSRLEENPKKSHSFTDSELVVSFSDLIKQRILDESICGFLTPFGVRCGRNSNDTTQPPCARRAHRDRTINIDKTLLEHFSDIAPQNCIGTSCDQAMIGPWSEAIKESLLWYQKLLRHQLGDKFNDDHFIEHAKHFIKQYGPPIKKVFSIEVLLDSSDSK